MWTLQRLCGNCSMCAYVVFKNPGLATEIIAVWAVMGLHMKFQWLYCPCLKVTVLTFLLWFRMLTRSMQPQAWFADGAELTLWTLMYLVVISVGRSAVKVECWNCMSFEGATLTFMTLFGSMDTEMLFQTQLTVTGKFANLTLERFIGIMNSSVLI